MRIRTKLAISFGVLLVLVVGQSLLLAVLLKSLTDASNDLTNDILGRSRYASGFGSALARHKHIEESLLISGPSGRESLIVQWDDTWAEVTDSFDSYFSISDSYAAGIDLEDIRSGIAQYEMSRLAFIAVVRQSEPTDARIASAKSHEEYTDLMTAAHVLQDAEFSNAALVATDARNSIARFGYLFIGSTFLVLAAGSVVGLFVWRSISLGLRRIEEATEQISRGDLDLPMGAIAHDEFDGLSEAFERMVEALKASRDENLLLHQQSLAIHQERIGLLRESFVKSVGAQEEERKRVARELHDQTGQALISLQLGLTRLERQLVTEERKADVVALRAATREAMEEVRNLALDLRPAALDELGLIPAMKGYARDLSERSGVAVTIEADGVEDRRMAPEVELTLFRTVQESLTNILKHASADHATVRFTRKDNNLNATVTDDGVGFDVAGVRKSSGRRALGLFGMEERVALLGGSLEIDSATGRGTTLRIKVPLVSPFAEKLEEGGRNHKQLRPHKLGWCLVTTRQIKTLLVDDHHVVRSGLRLLLESEDDIDVVGEAVDGLEAVQKAEALCPDVILMDISMPKLNGLEATRQIRQRDTSVGIIVLTMHEREEYFLQALKFGATGYVPKSAIDGEMLDAVRVVASGQVYIHPSVAKGLVNDYLGMVKATEVGDPYGRLTNREKEVFQFIASGATNREISESLHLSVNTVHNHRTKIMSKLGFHNRIDLLKFAMKRGLLDEDTGLIT